jgi:hypothetical protein
MKVCERCGEEIATRDGVGTCRACEDLDDAPRTTKARLARSRRRQARRERDEVMRSLGLKKVRGAMGGTYWE